MYSQCQTHRVSHRGVFVLERVHRVRGSSPRVSSSISSYDGQAGVSRQSIQSHLLHLPGPVLGLVEDTPSHSRLRDRGELQLRSLLSESSRRHTTHRSQRSMSRGFWRIPPWPATLARAEDSAFEECVRGSVVPSWP
jgi:hypothetical protein